MKIERKEGIDLSLARLDENSRLPLGSLVQEAQRDMIMPGDMFDRFDGTTSGYFLYVLFNSMLKNKDSDAISIAMHKAIIEHIDRKMKGKSGLKIEGTEILYTNEDLINIYTFMLDDLNGGYGVKDCGFREKENPSFYSLIRTDAVSFRLYEDGIINETLMNLKLDEDITKKIDTMKKIIEDIIVNKSFNEYRENEDTFSVLTLRLLSDMVTSYAKENKEYQLLTEIVRQENNYKDSYFLDSLNSDPIAPVVDEVLKDATYLIAHRFGNFLEKEEDFLKLSKETREKIVKYKIEEAIHKGKDYEVLKSEHLQEIISTLDGSVALDGVGTSLFLDSSREDSDLFVYIDFKNSQIPTNIVPIDENRLSLAVSGGLDISKILTVRENTKNEYSGTLLHHLANAISSSGLNEYNRESAMEMLEVLVSYIDNNIKDSRGLLYSDYYKIEELSKDRGMDR